MSIVKMRVETRTPPTIGRYKILKKIGQGAMGDVYLAEDPLIGRQVALKTFREFTEGSPFDGEVKQRFVREAHMAGILSHPNIVSVHDVGEGGGGVQPFIAMEYVAGADLRKTMDEAGSLSTDFVLETVRQITSGLSYAHELGVVHRDIKPANILLTDTKQVKISDFGIARLISAESTDSGHVLGTPNYMSPEQITGGDIDFRTDIFSLGVVLYEMVTGNRPFAGQTVAELGRNIVHQSYADPREFAPNLRPGLAQIIERSLQKSADDRYTSIIEISLDLEAIDKTNEALNSTVAIPQSVTSAIVSGDATAVLGDATAGAEGKASGAKSSVVSTVLAGVNEKLRLLLGVVAALVLCGAVWWVGWGRQDGVNPSGQAVEVASLPQGSVPRRIQVVDFRDRESTDGGSEIATRLPKNPPPFVSTRKSPTPPRRVIPPLAAPIAEDNPKGMPVEDVTVSDAPPSTTANQASTLRVELVSELSEGTLLVYDGTTQVLRRSFRFAKKGRGRKRSTGGSLTAETPLTRGDRRLRVYVSLKGRPAKLFKLSGSFPGGSQRTLRVRISADGRIQASLH